MTTCKLSLPLRYAPYIEQDKICQHCNRVSIFKGIIDLECYCCARTADDDDDEDDDEMPLLECRCVDCRIINNIQDTRLDEDEYEDEDEVKDILILKPDHSGSKEWVYISQQTQDLVSSLKWGSAGKTVELNWLTI